MTQSDVRSKQAGGARRRAPGAIVGGAVGLLSGVAALGAAELSAALFGESSSPVIAVGSATIDASPEWLKSFAIRTFGSDDKLALLVGIGAILAIAAIVLGALSVRRPRLGVLGLVVFGAIGIAASVSRPMNGILDAIPSVVGAAVGIAAFAWLRRSADLSPILAPPDEDESPVIPGYDRRRFLKTAVVTAGLAGLSSLVGRYLIRRADASASREAVRLPAPASAAKPLPEGVDLKVPELSSFITPNDSFYRVDTALFVPAVDADTWSLRIHGMVDRELTLDYQQVLARPLIERDITLTCVSNEVGGRYIGNARWLGAPLADVLREAGVQTAATQLVSRSTDGFTVGTPVGVIMDGRDAMLAVAMNGVPLPLEHGFPVRMVVPGLYGYVSATKWVVEMELTTFQAYDAYWVQRGWAQQATIKTESRIDTPKDGQRLSAGTIPIAGIAWAQHRGIQKVEVQVDDGEWNEAELSTQDSVDAWRQWLYRWNATPGEHVLSVRATDDDGVTQTATRVRPFPNGATGYHTIAVNVE